MYTASHIDEKLVNIVDYYSENFFNENSRLQQPSHKRLHKTFISISNHMYIVGRELALMDGTGNSVIFT